MQELDTETEIIMLIFHTKKGHSLASLIATTVWKWNYFPLLVMVIFSLYLCEDSDDGH